MIGNKVPIIQERDRRLLRELAVLIVVDREQAKVVAGFHSTTRVNVRLLALTEAGLLKRFFLGTIGGARKALYALAPAGANLVQVPLRGPRRRHDETLVTDFFVMHQLRTNEVMLAARYGNAPHDFATWQSFHEPLHDVPPVIPDGYLAFTGYKELHAFIEADLGHETTRVWRKKVEAYVSYAVSGKFTERFGHRQFRVLVVAPSPTRIALLRTTTAQITEKIFWFTTFDAIRTQGFWSSIWLRPTDTTPQSLIEAPSS